MINVQNASAQSLSDFMVQQVSCEAVIVDVFMVGVTPCSSEEYIACIFRMEK
jgi:hypothetical protein